MQFKNGLALFQRTNVKGSRNLISWHSPHSLTWSWIVSFSPFRSDEARVFPLWRRAESNVGIQRFFRIPFIGIVRFHKQRPMWYRDMWRRRRDAEDTERYQRSTMAYTESRPTIVDGGQSLH